MASRIITGTIVTAASALALAAGNASAVEFTAGDTSVQIYGYTIGKASYDIDENLGSAVAGSFGNVNTGADEDNEVTGHFDLSATQSRIGFITSTDMGGDALVTRIEGDFLGGDGGEFRLRHAYGSWNGILGGQTWSNYNSFVGSTPTIDFNSVAGNAGFQSRVAQFRYTMGNFSVALEDPKSSILGSDFDGDGVDDSKDSLPALTARYQASAGAFSYSVGGIVRQLEVDNGDDSASATGFGAFVAANFDMGAVSLQGALNFTDGTNSYLYLSGAPDAYVDADGDLQTLTGFGGTIGASIEAGNGSFNVGYGFTEVDFDDAEDDGLAVAAEDETRTNLFVNYLWSPVDNVTYGVEVGRFTVDEVDGADGDATRVSFMTQYSF